MHKIEIFPIVNLPIIKEGDNLGELISRAAETQGTPIQDEDIIVVTHVVVSRAEGNVINLNKIIPSSFAIAIANEMNKDP
ncbi:MAG: coenzyme F420-0:L-glutamate ligase, partial [Candidatus Jordarchaeaceae archaeon]